MPIWMFLCLALLAANLPWLSDRAFFVFSVGVKREAIRLLEWLSLYAVFLALGLGLERMTNGEVYAQDWEFYAVTVLIFLVFAIPGFIYHHDLRKHLPRARKAAD
ncbi:MAG: DUF2818 family protein [Pseudomonadota bacterium]